MQGSFRAGKFSRIQAHSNNMYGHQYSCTYKGGDLDTSNFESQGYEVGIIGLLALDWSFVADWDAGSNFLDDPPGLYPRSDGINLNIYTNQTDLKYFGMPAFRCISSSIASEASGKVTFNSSGKNQGSFTVPAGSV